MFVIFGLLFLSLNAMSQDVPSQQKLEGSDNSSIMMYLKIASVKYDSLIYMQKIVNYALQRADEIKAELSFLLNEAEKEMLKVLGRHGYNPDLYTILIKRNDIGEVELHIVKKSDLSDSDNQLDKKNILK